MSVTEIVPGKLVKVEPDGLGAKDVIELGEALIEEHGWVTGDSGDESRGWSIHGAIGEAAKRATGSTGKDSTEARPLRDEAARMMTESDPNRRGEFEINDQAQSVDHAVAAMRAARGAS